MCEQTELVFRRTATSVQLALCRWPDNIMLDPAVFWDGSPFFWADAGYFSFEVENGCAWYRLVDDSGGVMHCRLLHGFVGYDP